MNEFSTNPFQVLGRKLEQLTAKIDELSAKVEEKSGTGTEVADWIKQVDAAALVGVSKSTLAKWIRQDRIKYSRIDRNTVVERKSLLDYVASKANR